MHFVLLASGFLTFPGVCKWNFGSKRVIHVETLKLSNYTIFFAMNYFFYVCLLDIIASFPFMRLYLLPI